MSLKKIKDEPLDPGYGDVIPLPTSKLTNVKSESNLKNDGTNKDVKKISNSISSAVHDGSDDNEENENFLIKIKTGPEDTVRDIKIKNEPEDFPDDFFDCLNDENFLKEIAEDDDENSEIQNNKKAKEKMIAVAGPSNTTNNTSDDTNNELREDSSLSREIRKSRKIDKRKHKLALRTSALICRSKSSSEDSESTDEYEPETSTITEKRIKKEPKDKSYIKKERDYDRRKDHSRKKGEQKIKRRRSSSSGSHSSRHRSCSRSRSGSRDRSSEKRSRSGSGRYRSPSTSSRHRKKTRSRSRIRSRTRSRSLSRSPHLRSRNKRRTRSRSRSTDRNHYQQKSKKISFLEEITQKFAEEGIPFPEKDKIEKIIKKDISEHLKSETLRGSKSKAVSSESPQSHVTQSNEHYLINDSNNFMSTITSRIETETVDKTEKEEFPLPIKIKVEPTFNVQELQETQELQNTQRLENTRQDNEMNNRQGNDENDFPRPFVIKQESMEYELFNPTSMKIKEEKLNETPAMRRDRVLKTVTESIKKLHIYEQRKPLTEFLYTPTVIQQLNSDSNSKEFENRSPLNRINNVKFKFNSTTTNIDLQLYGLKSLPECTRKIASLIGFDAIQIIEKLNEKDLPYSLKILKKDQNNEDIKPDKFYKPFYTSTETQTEPYSCSTCLMRQLRKYQDTGVQIQPFVEDHCSQVDAQQIIDEIRSSISVMPMQTQQQQQYYPPAMGGNQHQQPQIPHMMFNNYGSPNVQQNQFMNSYPYPYQTQSAGYVQQPMMNPMMSMQNTPMYLQQMPSAVPSQSALSPQPVPPPIPQQSKYPPMKSHPGPRTHPSSAPHSPQMTLSSSSLSGVRRSNLIVPTSSSTTHRNK